jgi:hypothetical protein
MADVRFLILCGPPSLDPSTVGYPPSDLTMVVSSGENGSDATESPGHARPARVAVRRRQADEWDGWWYAWRLMASNNRRLARGVTSFVSRRYALDAIARLRTGLVDVQPLVSTDPRDGSWGWRAELDGVPVAVCPHQYERERDCRNGFTRFIDAVSGALIAEGGIILRDHRNRFPASSVSRSPRDG